MIKTILLLGLEILPLLIFFTLGQYVPFLTAVGGYILSTIATVGIIWHLQKRVSYLALIFGTVIIISGCLSIWLDNPNILLLADTLYYLSGGTLLFVLSQWRINVMQKLFGQTFAITDRGWWLLNQRWTIALIIAGLSNELIRQTGTTDDWLLFQILRTATFIIFATYQFTLTRRHRLPLSTVWGVTIIK